MAEDGILSRLRKRISGYNGGYGTGQVMKDMYKQMDSKITSATKTSTKEEPIGRPEPRPTNQRPTRSRRTRTEDRPMTDAEIQAWNERRGNTGRVRSASEMSAAEERRRALMAGEYKRGGVVKAKPKAAKKQTVPMPAMKATKGRKAMVRKPKGKK